MYRCPVDGCDWMAQVITGHHLKEAHGLTKAEAGPPLPLKLDGRKASDNLIEYVPYNPPHLVQVGRLDPKGKHHRNSGTQQAGRVPRV